MESSSSLKEDQFMGVGLTLNIEELIDRYKKKQKIKLWQSTGFDPFSDYKKDKHYLM